MTESLLVHAGFDYPIEARVTEPDEPGRNSSSDARDWFVAEMMLKYGDGQVIVNHDTALTYTAVWRCVTYISGTIASLGWHTYEKQRDGRTKLPVFDNISWLCGMQASPEVNAFEWRQVMLKDALTWGNGYAEIERDGAGRPFWLHRIDPSRVCLERDERTDELYYSILGVLGGPSSYLNPENMYHLKGPGPDGLVGWSMIQLFRKTIELGMTQEQYGQNFFRRGPTPGGVLTIPGTVKKEERDAMRKSFETTYGGSKNAGRVVVLTGGNTFEPLVLPNKDAEFLESRRFSVEEVCRIYGVPPHKLADLTRSTNNNIEHQSIEAVQDCLLPWCRRLETEANVKLYGRNTMGRRYTSLNLNTLLRGDSRTQTENLATQVNTAMATPNEARELLERNPLPDGDNLMVQGAMIPLERALEEPPAPAPTPKPMPKEDDDQAAALSSDVARTFGNLLASAYHRYLKTEADKADKAHRDDRKSGLRLWSESFYSNGAASYVANGIRPIIEGLLLATGRGTERAGGIAEALASRHVANSRGDLEKAGVGVLDSWRTEEKRAAEQARSHLVIIWEEMRK
jgi:HK97 family phage portal protein